MPKLIKSLTSKIKASSALSGIFLMVISVMMVSIMFASSKFIGDTQTNLEKVFYRGLIALIIITTVMLLLRRTGDFIPKRPMGQLIRGVAGTTGMLCCFWAYSLMPMTEVTALMFTGGFMTLLISPFALGEKVGPYRWGAVIIGFIGAIIVAQPLGDNFNLLGVSASLMAAFIGGALISIFLRSLGKTEQAFTTVFYFLLISVVLLLPYMLLYGHFVPLRTLPLAILMGTCGAAALYFKTEAYRHAEASLLSPVFYTGIIWSMLFDIIFWNTPPNIYVYGGAALVIGANIFILWREQKNKSPVKDLPPVTLD